MHGSQRAKTFAINYKLAAAMQQMGCGSTDIATLAGFLDIPVSWSSVARHMKAVEEVMGPIQIEKKEESEMEAVRIEVQSQMDHDDHLTHESTIEGHEHPPLPLIKCSHGN